jgi:hypothetical protein
MVSALIDCPDASVKKKDRVPVVDAVVPVMNDPNASPYATELMEENVIVGVLRNT